MKQRISTLKCILLLGLALCSSPGHAAEGGSSNYLAGTYGDFGVALTPAPGFYVQNSLYYYCVVVNRTVRGGWVHTNRRW